MTPLVSMQADYRVLCKACLTCRGDLVCIWGEWKCVACGREPVSESVTLETGNVA